MLIYLTISVRQNPRWHCTTGVTKTDLIVDLNGYGTVWIHADGIANILFLSRLQAKDARKHSQVRLGTELWSQSLMEQNVFSINLNEAFTIWRLIQGINGE
jgi:hypothetical protein